VTREKSIDTRLEAFREQNGTDVEAFVAAWREGSVDDTAENRKRAAEAESLWRELKGLRPSDADGG